MPFIPDPNALAEITRNSDNIKGILPLPLSHSLFSFDSFGIASFFGGDNALTGVVTVILMPVRRWLGWYNLPGSIEIAKQYARLAKMQSADNLFPDGENDPTRLFNLDGAVGPKFIAAHSGVVLDHTGHPGNLLMKKVKTIDVNRQHVFNGTNGDFFTGQTVTVVDLRRCCKNAIRVNSESKPSLAEGKIKTPILSRYLPTLQAFFPLIPMVVSMGACILCALVGDWFCFASIAVGMVAHGFACLVIGSGKLIFGLPKASLGALSGDGVLKGDRDLVILVGADKEVNALTGGRFFLKYRENVPYWHQYYVEEDQPEQDFRNVLEVPSQHPQHPRNPAQGSKIAEILHDTTEVQVPFAPPLLSCPLSSSHLIWVSALLLMAQPLIQFFLIPLGTLFGQVMFIMTIIVSWTYNFYLSRLVSYDDFQSQMVFDTLDIKENDITKFRFCTWPSTIAFTCFVLNSTERLDDPLSFLNSMLPSNTAVWKVWKRKMMEVLKDIKYLDKNNQSVFRVTDADLNSVEERHQKLLEALFHDTQDALDAWAKIDKSYMVTPVEIKDEAENRLSCLI